MNSLHRKSAFITANLFIGRDIQAFAYIGVKLIIALFPKFYGLDREPSMMVSGATDYCTWPGTSQKWLYLQDNLAAGWRMTGDLPRDASDHSYATLGGGGMKETDDDEW